MVRIAIAGNAAFEASELEVERPGPHYSVETVEAISLRHPQDELYFLVGADVLPELPTWKTPSRIFELARLVVVNREGGTFDSNSPFPYDKVSMPSVNIASHLIRDRIARNGSVRYQVSRGVEAYIREHRLYHCPS